MSDIAVISGDTNGGFSFLAEFLGVDHQFNEDAPISPSAMYTPDYSKMLVDGISTFNPGDKYKLPEDVEIYGYIDQPSWERNSWTNKNPWWLPFEYGNFTICEKIFVPNVFTQWQLSTRFDGEFDDKTIVTGYPTPPRKAKPQNQMGEVLVDTSKSDFWESGDFWFLIKVMSYCSYMGIGVHWMISTRPANDSVYFESMLELTAVDSWSYLEDEDEMHFSHVFSAATEPVGFDREIFRYIYERKHPILPAFGCYLEMARPDLSDGRYSYTPNDHISAAESVMSAIQEEHPSSPWMYLDGHLAAHKIIREEMGL